MPTVLQVIPSFISFWLLAGISTGTALAIILVVFLISSKGLKKGLTVVTGERLIRGLSERKGEFVSHLETELMRRGMNMRKPLEPEYDLIHRGFFNVANVYCIPEKRNLRYGYRISVTNQAIVLGILLMIPFLLGAVVVFVATVLRQYYMIRSLQEAGEGAELLTNEVPEGDGGR